MKLVMNRDGRQIGHIWLVLQYVVLELGSGVLLRWERGRAFNCWKGQNGSNCGSCYLLYCIWLDLIGFWMMVSLMVKEVGLKGFPWIGKNVASAWIMKVYFVFFHWEAKTCWEVRAAWAKQTWLCKRQVQFSRLVKGNEAGENKAKELVLIWRAMPWQH